MQAARTTKSSKYIILLHSVNIRMLHSTFEGSFECRTFVYALVWEMPIGKIVLLL